MDHMEFKKIHLVNKRMSWNLVCSPVPVPRPVQMKHETSSFHPASKIVISPEYSVRAWPADIASNKKIPFSIHLICKCCYQYCNKWNQISFFWSNLFCRFLLRENIRKSLEILQTVCQQDGDVIHHRCQLLLRRREINLDERREQSNNESGWSLPRTKQQTWKWKEQCSLWT